MDKKSRCRVSRCQECRAPCTGDFKKVVDLQNSGLIIYAHKEAMAKPKKSMKDETFIFHNTSDKELKRPEFINELCTYRTRCFQCKTVVQRVRNLLDEITAIRRNQTLGICVYCKRSNTAGRCKKCELIVKKFISNKTKQYEDRQSRFKSWLHKVRLFLQGVLETEKVCRHKIYQESNSTAELEKLLQELRSPLSMRQPEIGIFSTTESGRLSLESLTENKELLEQFLSKLKSTNMGKQYSSDESLYVSPSKTATTCACKYFMDKKIEERRSMEVLTNESVPPPVLTNKRSDINDKKIESKDKTQSVNEKEFIGKSLKEILSNVTERKVKPKPSKEKKPDQENMPPETPSKEKPAKELKSQRPGKEQKAEKPAKEPKPIKPKVSSEEQLFLKLMKDKLKEKQNIKKIPKQEKLKPIPKIDDLPEPKRREKIISIVQEVSESVVECGDQHAYRPEEMIKRTNIVPYDPHYRDKEVDSIIPILYKVKPDCPEPVIVKQISPTVTPIVPLENKLHDIKSFGGAFRYELSNREFIDKGWTVLPTTKIMRRMNVYKMEPSKCGWFERHKHQKQILYDTGEKMAEIDHRGRGKWFYKNGLVALEYYNVEELNGGQRYIVYSSGEKCDNGKNMPVTVLASFDYHGNGVVYDHFGNIRLKYNQSEGVVVDEKIGPPGRWKWHTLNDPPVLQPIFVNTYVKTRNPCLERIVKTQKEEADSRHGRTPNAEMLAIELDNFVKEKANKMLQKFKPFQIRTKVLKVNEQFSLRVLDQSNIYLLFRNPPISIKLNLGMMLISDEIVDTDTAEVSQVATPYDHIPPKSQSMANIQQTLNRARKIGKHRACKHYAATEVSSASQSSNI